MRHITEIHREQRAIPVDAFDTTGDGDDLRLADAAIQLRGKGWWDGDGQPPGLIFDNEKVHAQSPCPKSVPLAVGGRCAEIGQPATRTTRPAGVSLRSAMERTLRRRRMGCVRAESPI